jgi:hypothetical protein
VFIVGGYLMLFGGAFEGKWKTTSRALLKHCPPGLFPWEQSFECPFSQIWGHFKHLKFELASAHFAAI